MPVEHGYCTILNPVGKLLAESTYRSPYLGVRRRRPRLPRDALGRELAEAARSARKYGRELHICEPDGHLGLLMLTYSGDKVTLDEIMTEFGLETWDSYYNRCVKARQDALGII